MKKRLSKKVRTKKSNVKLNPLITIFLGTLSVIFAGISIYLAIQNNELSEKNIDLQKKLSKPYLIYMPEQIEESQDSMSFKICISNNGTLPVHGVTLHSYVFDKNKKILTSSKYSTTTDIHPPKTDLFYHPDFFISKDLKMDHFLSILYNYFNNSGERISEIKSFRPEKRGNKIFYVYCLFTEEAIFEKYINENSPFYKIIDVK